VDDWGHDQRYAVGYTDPAKGLGAMASLKAARPRQVIWAMAIDIVTAPCLLWLIW
jgi:hypothetical protein